MPHLYKSRKSKKVTWFLVRWFGWLGAHRFYSGRMISGFLYLCSLGGFFIGWSLDIKAVWQNRFKDEIGHLITDDDERDIEGNDDRDLL
jgi:TM2 domain-containing membrane protein YozV